MAWGNGTCCADWVLYNAGRHPVVIFVCCPTGVSVGKPSLLLPLGMFSKEIGICESSWFSFHTSLVITGAKANSEIAAQTYHSL